jgi:hypothetical protein
MTDIAEMYENQADLPGQHDSVDGEDEDEKLVKEITDNLKEGRIHWSEWRKQAREDYDFFASNQWDDDDKAKLAEEQRPAVVFNRIARTVNAVVGLEKQNRQEVRFLPREIDDSGFGEYFSSAAKWVRDQCDAEDEESETFEDSIVCGIGWTETRMDYETDADGMICEDRIDPLEMLVDPNAKKRNFSDSKWRARILELTRQEIKEIWPDKMEDISPSTFWQDSMNDPHDSTNAWKYENDQSDKLSKPGKYSIAQYQCVKRKPYYKVLSDSGEFMELDPEKFKKLQPYIKAKQLKYVKLIKKVYYQAFVCGNKLLEYHQLGCEHFTLNAVTGLRDRNKNIYFGLVTLMKDPQRWANKWLSQIQHILNTGAKTGLIVEEGAITNPQKFERDYAKPGSINSVTPGALRDGKIKEKEAPRYPEGIDRLLQYALSSIQDVPGVNLEMIGMADRDQAFSLEESRKKAGITVLATFFDSLRRFRKQQGRVLAYFIREYIADGRLIRILGEQGAQYVPLIKDKLAFTYDIIVDDAPNSPNMKEKVFNVLSGLLPMLLQAGIPVPPDVLDYSPLPDGLIQKWKQMIAASSEDPYQEELKNINLMLAQLDAAEKQKNIEEKDSVIVLNHAKAQQAAATGQDEMAQSMQKMGLADRENQLKAEAMAREQERKDIEMMLNQRRKMLEAKMNARIKSQQSSNQRAQ